MQHLDTFLENADNNTRAAYERLYERVYGNRDFEGRMLDGSLGSIIHPYIEPTTAAIAKFFAEHATRGGTKELRKIALTLGALVSAEDGDDLERALALKALVSVVKVVAGYLARKDEEAPAINTICSRASCLLRNERPDSKTIFTREQRKTAALLRHWLIGGGVFADVLEGEAVTAALNGETTIYHTFTGAFGARLMRSVDLATKLSGVGPTPARPGAWEGFDKGGLPFRFGEAHELTAFSCGSRLGAELAPTAATVFEAMDNLAGEAFEVNRRVLEVAVADWNAGRIHAEYRTSVEDEIAAAGSSETPRKRPEAKPTEHNGVTISGVRIRRDQFVTEQVIADCEERGDWKPYFEALNNHAKTSGVVNGVQALLVEAASYLNDDQFYYSTYGDFRYRLYYNAGALSPQGGDLSKALLRFKAKHPVEGKGSTSWAEFAYAGAAHFGYDKATPTTREIFVEQNHELFMRIAADPVATFDEWQTADEPYQALAWCFEYAELAENGFYGELPGVVAYDGSCSGLQWLSALKRDRAGAISTNLVTDDERHDVYLDVLEATPGVLEQVISELNL